MNETIFETEHYTLMALDAPWQEIAAPCYHIVNKEFNITEHACPSLPGALNSIIQLQEHLYGVYDALNEAVSERDEDETTH